MLIRASIALLAMLTLTGCAVDDPLVNEDRTKSSGLSTTDSDAAPNSVSSTDYIEEQVSRQYSTQTGRTLFLECPEEVRLEPGIAIECEAFDADDEEKKFADLIITVTTAEGDFAWEAVRVK